LFVSTGACAEQAPNNELASTLLGGIQSRVEKLQSGIVEFEVLSGEGVCIEKRFVAFDSREGCVRSDMETCRDGAKARTVKVVCTKTDFLQYVKYQGFGSLSRLNPGQTSNVADGMPIDVRAVGLCDYHALQRGGTANNVLKSFGSMSVTDVVLDRDIGLVVMKSNADETTRIALWVDTSRDYVPVQLEVRDISPEGESVLHQRLETEWGRTAGNWVPLRSSFRLFRDNAVCMADEMRFTWKSVNEKVPETLFTADSLELPDNTYIVDTRLGTPILEKVVGRDRPLPPLPPGPPTTPVRRAVLTTITITLLVALIALFIYRRRMKTSSL
jgi:hypothetical protein